MNIKISKNEGKWVMLALLIPKLFFTPIYNLISRSGTGAYIEVIYISLIALILTAIIIKLYSAFEGNDIYSIVHFALGKTGVMVFGAVMFLMSLTNTAIMLRIFSSVISLLTLKGSTLFFIMAFIALTMFVSARKSINGLSKISVLWGAFIFLILLSVFLVCIPEIDPNNIFPIAGNGFSEIITGYEDLPVFYEIVYFVFLLPYVGKNYKNVGCKSIIIYSLILLASTLVYILLVPYPISEKFKFPLLQITSSVNLDILFQRIEALYLIAVIFSAFTYLGITFSVSVNVAKHTFCIADYKAIIGALLIIVVTLALSVTNTERAFELYNLFSRIFLIVGYSLVAIILTLANIKRKISKEEIKS